MTLRYFVDDSFSIYGQEQGVIPPGLQPYILTWELNILKEIYVFRFVVV